MCQHVSFCIGRGDEKVYLGISERSHRECAEEFGLAPDSYVEGEWTSDNPDTLTIRTIPERDGYRDQAWYRAVVLAQYPTRKALLASQRFPRMPTPAQLPDRRLRSMCSERMGAGRLRLQMPTPAEEEDPYIRFRLAQRMLPDFLPKRYTTLQDEPDDGVREVLAYRCPRWLLPASLSPGDEPYGPIRVHWARYVDEGKLPDRLPTAAEEPAGLVRSILFLRDPGRYAPLQMPTPEEEPDVTMRWNFACYLSAERLPDAAGIAKETDLEIRGMLQKRAASRRG
jgi:hypothetical protein